MKHSALYLLLPAVCILSSCGASQAETATEQNVPAPNQSLQSSACTPADKVIVANFHGTRRCAACIEVGKMAQKTIEQEFRKETRKGTVEFLSIDGELPENRDSVLQYRARGSSLYINAIRNGEETIQEDVNVWRLIGNEENYIRYLRDKINSLLTCA